MRQGWKFLPVCAAFALCAAAIAPVAPAALAAAKGGGSSSGPAKKSVSMRQFTGVVTALDKSSLTVEKSGKTARTIVFSKHADMRTTGNLEKNARVTVYYREEGGQPVAHRVVVKIDADGQPAGGR